MNHKTHDSPNLLNVKSVGIGNTWIKNKLFKIVWGAWRRISNAPSHKNKCGWAIKRSNSDPSDMG